MGAGFANRRDLLPIFFYRSVKTIEYNWIFIVIYENKQLIL